MYTTCITWQSNYFHCHCHCHCLWIFNATSVSSYWAMILSKICVYRGMKQSSHTKWSPFKDSYFGRHCIWTFGWNLELRLSCSERSLEMMRQLLYTVRFSITRCFEKRGWANGYHCEKMYNLGKFNVRNPLKFRMQTEIDRVVVFQTYVPSASDAIPNIISLWSWSNLWCDYITLQCMLE